MRCFQNIAKLIKSKRVGHTKNYSQSELSHLLGYKNGQFISNVERALCNIPLKMLRRVSEILDIPAEDLKMAILKDQESTLNRYLYGPAKRRNDDNIVDTDDIRDENEDGNIHQLDEHKKRKLEHDKDNEGDDEDRDDFYKKDVA
ncbi:MAG: helix-turn-helix transcriptional regulator [Oligoflexia bacterium]|nr:helix-turn-helix transcriptional regulator [Oligoflexia bacterium]MBF0364877.1 helix-turn-helix transcriptional regulator [Oligoflexia bacterium]